jgi:hypothetical protein
VSIQVKNTPETAIDNVEIALRYLSTEYRVEAWLETDRYKKKMPKIRRDFFGGHYDAWFSAHEFYVTQRVADELKDRGYVDGKKEWGYTNHYKCRLNYLGEEVLSDILGKEQIIRTIMES